MRERINNLIWSVKLVILAVYLLIDHLHSMHQITIYEE